MATRRGVYWARARGGLWRKCETSGAGQALHAIALSFDAAALARPELLGALERGSQRVRCDMTEGSPIFGYYRRDAAAALDMSLAAFAARHPSRAASGLPRRASELIPRRPAPGASPAP